MFGLPLAMMGGLIRQVAFSQMRVLQHAADTAKKFYGGNASLVDTAGLREVGSKMFFFGLAVGVERVVACEIGQKQGVRL